MISLGSDGYPRAAALSWPCMAWWWAAAPDCVECDLVRFVLSTCAPGIELMRDEPRLRKYGSFVSQLMTRLRPRSPST